MGTDKNQKKGTKNQIKSCGRFAGVSWEFSLLQNSVEIFSFNFGKAIN
jgi:hypothetical protein